MIEEWPIPKVNKEYVLGFMFDEQRKHVVLIKKEKPEWQRGCFNGVGGKIEEFDKQPVNAMVREFKEETGKETTENDWKSFSLMHRPGDYRVWCFKSFAKELNVDTKEDEQIVVMRLDDLKDYKRISNLDYLIEMALDNTIMMSILEMA